MAEKWPVWRIMAVMAKIIVAKSAMKWHDGVMVRKQMKINKMKA